MTEPVTRHVKVGSARIATATWGNDTVKLVMAHDGLGSIRQWRSVPAMIAAATNLTVLAYDRPGHGTSTPVPAGPWPPDWHSVEAQRLGLLLEAVDAQSPILVGHSDGATISLLHAAAHPTGVLAPSGVMALAPHTWVERKCTSAIETMAGAPAQIVASLAKSHDHAAELFAAWSGGWLNPAFAPWDIRRTVASVTCPTMVVQGAADQYATDQQAIETAAAVGANASYRLLDGLGHVLHHDDPATVVALVADFVAGL